MEEISQLIQEMSADEASAEKAIAKLVSIGMPSVPEIIDAIRSGSETRWKLSEVLLQIRHPDLVPVFIELLQEENTDLVVIASEGLGQSQDERALQPLLNILSGWRQFGAVKALGELRNPQAVEPLVKVAKEILNQPSVSQAIEGTLDIDNEDFDESLVEFLPTIIIALAKLGNYEISACCNLADSLSL
jgi:HEAT repeat protein